MALNKQIHLYSVDTSAFYNKEELDIHNKMLKLYSERSESEKRVNVVENILKKIRLGKELSEKELDNEDDIEELEKRQDEIKVELKIKKEELKNQFKITKQNKEKRVLSDNYLRESNIISIFESSLTRTEMETNKLTDNLIIVQTFFFDVIEDIIKDGFATEKGEKYICFTASAGQIRTKKTVFIKESFYDKYKNTITCGLTLDKINSKGGINVNKYLAYLALCNSATDVWKEFDIDKTIVVDDFETMIDVEVDYIDHETYEINREVRKVPIPHTDGCGMMILSKKNRMVRIPWVKGLLVNFSYDKFIREANKRNPKVNHALIKDIYGKEYDILKDNIQVIFTKSQFKMYKYYESWDEYKNNYKKYNCDCGYCNIEEDEIDTSKINYQMLQTLTDMKDEELQKISQETINRINNINSDRNTMLKVLGANKRKQKNSLQKSLEIYPELLNDDYCKEVLRKVKKSVIKKAKAGKLYIDGKYTFISPDLYAFCEWLFLGEKNPKGLLKDKEVWCSLYKNSEKLDCLRSPHLYKEHAVRFNKIYEGNSEGVESEDIKEIKRWFSTKALYTSIHDCISKVLMFDVDGDKALVCADKTIIKVAERNMEGIVPLYYDMKKAESKIIDSNIIFEGLHKAYTGGNIGLYSNDITKISNDENFNEENVEVIKLLCMENNFVIDYAKTLYKPTRPDDKNELIRKYTKNKTPHFFIYAKDKKQTQVEPINNSVVNRLENIIPNPSMRFNSSNVGKFDYSMLISEDVDINYDIVEFYKELDIKKPFMIKFEDKKYNNVIKVYGDIRDKLVERFNDEDMIVNTLVKYLYSEKKSRYKTTLWECFGNIIFNNIKNNIIERYPNTVQCECCGKRIKKKAKNTKYCSDCAKEIKKQKDKKSAKISMRNKRKSKYVKKA